MVPISRRMGWTGSSVHRTTQEDLKFKKYELFIYGISLVVFSGRIWMSFWLVALPVSTAPSALFPLGPSSPPFPKFPYLLLAASWDPFLSLPLPPDKLFTSQLLFFSNPCRGCFISVSLKGLSESKPGLLGLQGNLTQLWEQLLQTRRLCCALLLHPF